MEAIKWGQSVAKNNLQHFTDCLTRRLIFPGQWTHHTHTLTGSASCITLQYGSFKWGQISQNNQFLVSLRQKRHRDVTSYRKMCFFGGMWDVFSNSYKREQGFSECWLFYSFAISYSNVLSTKLLHLLNNVNSFLPKEHLVELVKEQPDFSW